MNAPSWTCLGDETAHSADLVETECIRDRGSTLVAIQRCRTCGQLYRWLHYELNDWSGGGDYCDETMKWSPIEPDEVESVRRDPNYAPRSGREHRHDTGWRREGP